jgi:hypothetical protein
MFKGLGEMICRRSRVLPENENAVGIETSVTGGKVLADAAQLELCDRSVT